MTLFYSTFFNGIFFFFFQAYLSFSLSEINHGFPRFSRVCFARGIRKIHRSVFIETREEGAPSIRDKKFLRSSSFDGRGKGGEAKVWGKGKGKNTRPATSNFFPTRCTRKTRKIVAVPPSAPLPYSREDSIVEIRIESRFHDSAMISTIDGRL